jgi:hypothetical protein
MGVPVRFIAYVLPTCLVFRASAGYLLGDPRGLRTTTSRRVANPPQDDILPHGLPSLESHLQVVIPFQALGDFLV